MKFRNIICLFTALFFIGVNMGYADYTAKEAADRLTSDAYAKIDDGLLKELITNGEQEVFVLYKENTRKLAEPFNENRKERKRIKKEEFARAKASVHSKMSESEIEVLSDYDLLPVSFVKIKTRKGMVDLLNDDNVLKIYQKRKHTLFLNESLSLINQTEVAATHRGNGTAVVVLDTGVDLSSDPFDCTVGASDCPIAYVQDFANDDSQEDDIGHGTVVSKVVHAVAGDADLIVLDIFGEDALGNLVLDDDDALAAMNWSIQNQEEYNIVAMNLSWGDSSTLYTNYCSSIYDSVFENLRYEGIIPVVASGNDRANTSRDGIADPACSEFAVSVGSVYDSSFTYEGGSCSEEASADVVSCFSNSSPLLTLLAPGANITNGTEEVSGTSFSAPHVAGAIAVLRAPGVAPYDTVESTIFRMTSTGVPIEDREDTGWVIPRLDLEAAVNSVEPYNDIIFFDPFFYSSNYPDLLEVTDGNNYLLLLHWLNHGIEEGRRASRYFDVLYYHDQYADLASTYGDDWYGLYEHWMAYGISEGRRGALEFDAEYYGDYYSDLSGNANALYLHWILYGIDEGRRGSLEFDPQYYLNAYPDLEDEFGWPLSTYRQAFDHWIVTGKNDGLIGSADMDTSAPEPNPSTFSSRPDATGKTTITMTATEATDPSGVEYYFENISGSGHDSGWQSSNSYTDTGLSSNTTYSYRVMVRDESPNQNQTTPSSSYSATTDSSSKGLCGASPMYRNSKTGIFASRTAAGKLLLPLVPSFLCLCAWGVINRRRKL